MPQYSRISLIFLEQRQNVISAVKYTNIHICKCRYRRTIKCEHIIFQILQKDISFYNQEKNTLKRCFFPGYRSIYFIDHL